MDQPSLELTSSLIVTIPTQVLIPVRALAINALDPSIPPETQNQLLSLQYRHVTRKDALATGNAYFCSVQGNLVLRTSRPEPAFKGLVFEAALERLCREEPLTVGRRAFAWCTNRTVGRVPDKMISEYIPFITGDQRLLNFPLTATFYNPGSPLDVQFYKVNDKGAAELATQVNTGALAGIQVKAIQGNERSEIIDRLVSGRYPHVLTMLKHPSGEHSYEVCRRILTAMLRSAEIDGMTFADVLSRITYPEALGIDQMYIDNYSVYISRSYQQQVQMTPDAAAAIALEVTENLIMSPGGILLPTIQDLILPPTLQ